MLLQKGLQHMINLLLTGCFPYSSEQINEIIKLGFNVTYHADEKVLVDHPEKFEIVICNGLFLYNDINKFVNLKAIQVTSAGLDRLPLDYIKEKNIILNNARGIYSIPIAEYVIMNILNVLHKNESVYLNVKQKKWIKVRTCQELNEQNVLIVGCGSIGQEIAKRLKAFACNIIGIDTKLFKNDYFSDIKSINELNNYLPWASIVILCCPITEATKGLFDYNRLSLMKETSIIVNIARGELIVEKDLIKILKQRNDFYAILDVFEQEPLNSDNDLWSMDNVIISPHNSFVSTKNNVRMYQKIYDFLLNYYKKIAQMEKNY